MKEYQRIIMTPNRERTNRPTYSNFLPVISTVIGGNQAGSYFAGGTVEEDSDLLESVSELEAVAGGEDGLGFVAWEGSLSFATHEL
jgi:hypothetical protein